MIIFCCFLFQCARVSSLQNRLWVRLVSNRHDIQMWLPDTRKPQARKCNRSVNSLGQKEEWMRSILEYLSTQYVVMYAMSDDNLYFTNGKV